MYRWAGAGALGGISVALCIAGCGGDTAVPGDAGTGASGVGGAATGAGGAAAGGSGTTSSTTGSVGGGSVAGSCHAPPPDGAAQPPAPKPYAGGACPVLVDGANTITTAGGERKFLLATPHDVAPGTLLPVAFLWHWLGGDAQDFYDKGEVAEAVELYDFVAVIPEKKGDVQFAWPFSNLDSQARMEEEFAFFDDMLACVSAQFAVAPSCVASVGVSSGALFTSQLAGGRGEYLSSILVLSGGVGGGLVKPWTPSAHKMPAMVLWGGPSDNCYGVMNFEDTSKNLEKALTSDGHFFVECIHNCGHSEPPLATESSLTKFSALWEFIGDHPHWLDDGQSPYLQLGVPPALPVWCGIGAGSATPREGECTSESGC